MTGFAVDINVQTNVVGNTPEVVGVNLGHFHPNGHTHGWMEYLRPTGARIFASVKDIEPDDDIPGHGDGVTDQAGFLARRAALRADHTAVGEPSNTYINWPYFEAKLAPDVVYGKPGKGNVQSYGHAMEKLSGLGISILMCIGGTEIALPIIDAADWAGKWELWQHYYARAYHHARYFNVQRYQMYNEPNYEIGKANWLDRLKLASDAIQAAIADVNSKYGKSLQPMIFAPVNGGGFPNEYGTIAVRDIHKDFLGNTDPNFWLFHNYCYHQYDATPEKFGDTLAAAKAQLAIDIPERPDFPITLSEFNAFMGATFDNLSDTLDSPSKYDRLGAVAQTLVNNGINEMYLFKFSNVKKTTTYPNYLYQKNALCYADSDNEPYETGGMNKGGEAIRLLYKAFAPGRNRLQVNVGTGGDYLYVGAAHDPVNNRYYVYSANHKDNAGPDAPLVLNLSALGIPAGSQVILEEVSESSLGTCIMVTDLPGNRTISRTQPMNTVWLFTISANYMASEQVVIASEDAHVRDGVNNGSNYGSATALEVRNDWTTKDNRRAALIKFDLAGIDRSKIESAVLCLPTATMSGNSLLQAHVYGLDSTNWNQSTVTWNTAPNLLSPTAGEKIINAFVDGIGDTAHILGQLTARSTTPVDQHIDVTRYLRELSGSQMAVLISQDPRWDQTLPTGPAGDQQADGLLITSKEGGTGPRLRIRTTPIPSSLPSLSTDGGATAVGLHTATLHGLLTNGTYAEAYICWGPNDGGTSSTGNWANVVAIGAIPQNLPFSVGISALEADRSYSYRCYATNTYGVGWSAVASLRTVAAPAVSNTLATAISDTVATVNAAVDSDNTNCNVYVFYGTGDGGTNAAAWGASAYIGSLTDTASNVSYTVGLTPGTIYYYTFMASNSTRMVWSSGSISFKTRNAPTVNNSIGATALNKTSATLYGIITAGDSANAWICWGTSDGGTSGTGNWANVISMGAVIEGSAFSNLVTGLSPNTTYFYRCYAENAYGSNWSDSVTLFSGKPSFGADSVLTAHVGVNIVGSAGAGGTLAPEDVAGYVAQTNWNNMCASTMNDTLSSVYDSRGRLMPGMSVDTSIGAWDARVVSTATNEVTPHAKLFEGFIDDAAGPWAPRVRVRGIPLAEYDVYVYLNSANNGAGAVRLNGGGTEYYAKMGANPAFTGYTVCNDTNSPAGTVFNTVMFTGVSGATLDIDMLRTANRIGLCGIQLVGRTPIMWNLATSAISNSQAELNGTLLALGANYDVYVYYGPTDGGTNAAAWATNAYVGSWANVSTNLSYAVSNLTAGSTCHYTFMVSNVTETVWATPSWTFTTLGAAPSVTTNHAVPHAWLSAINSNWSANYEAVVTNDVDGDGFATWQEYWSGTDPQDSNSFLRIDSITFSGTNLLVSWRHAVVDAGVPPITIQSSTNLVSGSWVGIGTHAPTNGVNIWSAGSSVQGFYRLAVTNAP
jgi:hypothetical protein